jgi:primosomal protein N' (replication factor Y) (superfamily II helicase)
MPVKIVKIAIPVKVNALYSYSIPDGMDFDDVVGRRVLIDFNGRKIRGYAVSPGEYSEKYKIKEILKVLDNSPVFRKEMVDFAKWIADYYFAGIGEVLSIMVPKGIRPKEKKVHEQIRNKNFSVLSEEQNRVYNGISTDISGGTRKFYLYGVTGSGKTEIYIKLIEDVLNKGKSVIFLVPEIALSFQTQSRLREKFGDLCAVLHSNLKTSVRFGEYMRLFSGTARIAIGPRSALFAPLSDIGLIIIDEENESSYKSEESPRFHARTAALYLANSVNAVLLLGSATPSIESWYFAEKGFFKNYSLSHRYGGASLPEIRIINTENIGNKNLSLELTNEINSRLKNKEQVVLLQNRRGFSTLVRCKDCGFIFTCPRCDMKLTYHRSKDKLTCHHCGYNIVLPGICPSCSGKNLVKIGAGTQKIEDEISAMFSYARVQRMDHDIMKSEFDLHEIFKQIENGVIDILVGTQMIAKGLHFPNIKFVGIINADIMLNIPDFKASERTFALITQVAGRAGREGSRGFVMIQTMNPDHYSITCARDSNFEGFYNEEIQFRKILNMPPFSRLLRLIIRGKEESSVGKDMEALSKVISKYKTASIQILGPAPCMLNKINNNYRFQILLKSQKIGDLQEMVKKSMPEFKIGRKNYLEIDVDPTDLF